MSIGPVRDDAACGSEMVEQAAGGAVRGVDGAEEAPGLGQELAHLRGGGGRGGVWMGQKKPQDSGRSLRTCEGGRVWLGLLGLQGRFWILC